VLRRTAITAVAIMVLILLATFLAKQFSGPSASPQKQHVLSTKAKPWDGSAMRTYDTVFVRDNQQIELQDIDYAGLNTAATSITVHLQVTPNSGSTSWLAPSSFQIRSASEAVYDPHGQIVVSGPTRSVTLTLSRLPTTGLGNTCSAALDPTQALGLFIYSPDGVFVVQLVPPDAPAGHCFDSPPPTSSACQTAAQQMKEIQQADAKRALAIGKSHGKTKAALEKHARQALHNEHALRSQAQSVLASITCSPVTPTPGHALTAKDRAQDARAAAAANNGSGFVATH